MIELKINSAVEVLSIHFLDMNKSPSLEITSRLHPAGIIKDDNPTATISTRNLPVALLGELNAFVAEYLGAALVRREPQEKKATATTVSGPPEGNPPLPGESGISHPE